MKKILLLIAFIIAYTLGSFAQKDTTQLVSTWRTYNSGNLGDSTILIYADTLNFTYNFDVDWDNDGVFDSIGMTQTVIHQYADTGTYTIRIRGTFPRLFFGYTLPNAGFNQKIISFDQWGTTTWQRLDSAFFACLNMEYHATDSPDLTVAHDLNSLFNGNLKFNGDIGNWDVSAVTNMASLLGSCIIFNRDLSSWNVGNVTDMSNMFLLTDANFSLNNWDVSQVTNMSTMFAQSTYNQPLDQWNVANVSDFSSMFFQGVFSQPIDNWDVSSATNMRFMFSYSSFNQPINSWDVSGVTDMTQMFFGASTFNQALNNWNTSSLVNAGSMFSSASSFNQDISNWNVSNIFSLDNIVSSTALSVNNYDQLLIAWEQQLNRTFVNFGAIGLQYCLGDSARNNLINNLFWNINGDTLDCLGVGIEEQSAEETTVSFRIYPNPATEQFRLDWEGELPPEEPLLIYNLQGVLVQQERIAQQRQSISIPDLPNGLYLLRWRGATQRLIVTK